MRIEEQKIQRVEIKKTYISDDGIAFPTMEACKEYESTSKFVINKMFSSLNIQKNECVGDWDDLRCFGCDDTVYAIKIRNASDLEIVNKWIGTHEYANDFLKVEAIGTIQLICEYDFDSSLWNIGTPDDLKKMYCRVIDYMFDKLKSDEGDQNENG